MILQLIGIVIFVICVILEIWKWHIGKNLKNMSSPKPQYPVIGIGHRFIGKNNEGLEKIS